MHLQGFPISSISCFPLWLQFGFEVRGMVGCLTAGPFHPCTSTSCHLGPRDLKVKIPNPEDLLLSRRRGGWSGCGGAGQVPPGISQKEQSSRSGGGEEPSWGCILLLGAAPRRPRRWSPLRSCVTTKAELKACPWGMWAENFLGC